MSQIFISYSRKNGDIARRLHAALVARGKDVWIDLENIPPSADWMARITAAIDASRGVIFLLSDHSIASRVCGEEVDYAQRRTKRLIPVNLGVSDTQNVPETLQKLNWIALGTTNEDFSRAVDLTVRAIETDLEHVDLHTRLLVRGVEWESHGSDASYLLRGSDLKTAEAWLAESGGKDPPLSLLHTRYIQASRAGAQRRLRTTAYASLAAVVIATILAIVALVERQNARNETTRATDLSQAESTARKSAEAGFKSAMARQLAAQAELLINQGSLNLPRAALLALEALRREESVATDRAARLVLRLLPEPEGRFDLPKGEQCASLAASPDGARVAAVDRSGRAWLYTVSSGGPPPQSPATIRPQGATTVEFSDDGTLLVLGGTPSTVHRTQDGAEIWRGGADTLRAFLSQDSARLFEVLRDGVVRIRALSTSPLQGAIEFRHASPPAIVREKKSGKSLVTVEGSGQSSRISVWDVPSGAVARSFPIPDAGDWVAISPDGGLAVEAHGSIIPTRVWETLGGKQVAQLPVLSSVASPRLVFSRDGSRVFVAADDRTVRVLAVDGFTELTRVTLPKPVFGVWCSADGTRFAAAGDDGTARVFDSASGREIFRQTHGEYVPVLGFSADGSSVFSVSNSSNVILGARVSDWCEIMSSRPAAPEPHGLAWTADGARVTAQTQPSRGDSIPADVDRWVARAGVTLSALGVTRNEGHLLVSPDGRYLCEETPHWVVNVFDGQERGRRVLQARHEAMLPDVAAYSNDSSLFATTSADYGGATNFLMVYALPSGAPLVRVELPAGSTAAAFSPDGSRIALMSTDGVLRVHALRAADLKACIARRLRRNLTEQEWAANMNGLPYAATIEGLPAPIENAGFAGIFEADPGSFTSADSPSPQRDDR